MQYHSACTSGSGAPLLGQLYLGCCGGMTATGSILVYYPSTSPTPVPRPGNGTGPSGCDCTYPCDAGCDPTASGSVWNSDMNGGQEYWLNTASNQDMLTIQSFSPGTTQSYNNSGIGFKNVTAKRQWHGSYGWTSNDVCARDTSQPSDQFKYLTYGVGGSIVNHATSIQGSEIYQSNDTNTVGGSVTVNGNTGIITSTLISGEETVYTPGHMDDSGNVVWDTSFISRYVSGGAGYTSDGTNTTHYHSGMATLIDIFPDIHCSGSTWDSSVQSAVAGWNNNMANISNSYIGVTSSWPPIIQFLPPVTDPWSYGPATANYTVYEQTSGSVEYTESMMAMISSSAISFGETVVSYNATFNMTPHTMVLEHRHTYNLSLDFSGANTASAVERDCEGLLGYWNLADNMVYPWRTDEFTSYAPLVTRREVQTDVTPCTNYFIPWNIDDRRSPVADVNGNAPWTTDNPSPPPGWTYAPNNNDCTGLPYTDPDWSGPCGYITTWAQMRWEDPNSYYWVWNATNSYLADAKNSTHFDGTVIGDPMIMATGSLGQATAIGYGWFDFYGENIYFCPMLAEGCSGPSYIEWYYNHGGTLADLEVSVSGGQTGQFSTFLPQTATHAINNYQAHGLCRGAQRNSNVTDQGIWVTKWAETSAPAPHYNSFRPCGADRVLIDETTAQCFTTSSNVMAGSLTGLNGSKQVLVYGTGTDGIYTGCSQTADGDGTYTLHTGSLVSALPTDYHHDLASYYTNGFAGIVRFPSAWPICGHAACGTSATGSYTLLTFLAPQTNLRTGDHVDLYNNTSLLVGSQSVHRNTDTQFVVSSSYSGAITGTHWAQSTGCPSLDWYDSSPKNEFRVGSWFTSNRSTSLNTTGSCQQSCISSGPCRQSAVYLTPNGEAPAGSKQYWFTDGFKADSLGCIEQMNVEFWMQDPLYQQAFNPSPCYSNEDGGSVSIVQDDGTCHADTDDGLGNYTAYVMYPPQVEAVCALPTGAPALPAGVTIPAMIQPPLAGIPGYSFNTYLDPWTVYNNAVTNCLGCRFTYYWC